MSHMNNVHRETNTGDQEVSASAAKLSGLVFTPGTTASTLLVKDNTTTILTVKGAANGPSISLSAINIVVGNLVVNVAGTGAEVSVFHRPITG